MKKIYIENSHLSANLEVVECIFFNETCIPKDPANRHYAQFLQELKEGKAELVPYVPPAPTWEQIRAQRDALLKDSDWSVALDATPKPSKEAWLVYRQALRDIPNKFSKPEEVIWPEKP
jgi:hypothetical protein